jgi:hydrogenase nickel incorporation protein HypB
VCPAEFKLGADINVVVASVPEGHDKTYKYPGMFAAANAVLLNKCDLISVFEFDVDYFKRGLQMVNSDVAFFPISCRGGAGMDSWLAWLLDNMARRRTAAASDALIAGGPRL